MVLNFRKTTLALLALGLGGVANAGMYAAPVMAEPDPAGKSGFYIGVGGGAMNLTTKFSGPGSSVSADGLVETTQDSSNKGGALGWNTTAELGYAFALPKKMFLGVEAFGNYSNVSTSTTGVTSTTVAGATDTADTSGHYKLDFVYGARLLPGYQVTNDAVVYGIVGYARADSKLDTSATITRSDATVETLPTTTESFGLNGLELGLGSMIDVTEHVAIRGDIIWTGYENKTVDTSDTDAAGGTSSSSTKVSPSTVEANVGVVYKFD